MTEPGNEAEIKITEVSTVPDKRAELHNQLVTLFEKYRNTAPEDQIQRDEIVLENEDMIYRAQITDPATEFYNKKGLADELPRLMELAKRTGEPLSVLFLDGYKLKRINEQIGYEEGTSVILTMADAIKHTTRKTDVQARINPEEETELQPQHIATRPGGDEFVIILFGSNKFIAVNIARRIQDRIGEISPEQIPFYKDTFGEEFTARVGIAQYDPEIDQDYTSLLKRADDAIKSAKTQPIPDIICVNQYNPATKTSEILPMKGPQLILPEK